MSRIFSALGDEHRQRILLLFEPNERLNVSQIADGGGHEIERTFGILLAGSDVGGCLEQRFGIEGHNKIPGR